MKPYVVACHVCNRVVAARFPKGGDGTAFPARHKSTERLTGRAATKRSRGPADWCPGTTERKRAMKLRDNQALRDEVRTLVQGDLQDEPLVDAILDAVDRAITATGPGSGATCEACAPIASSFDDAKEKSLASYHRAHPAAPQTIPPRAPRPVNRYERDCCWPVGTSGVECGLPLGHDGQCAPGPPESPDGSRGTR